jgi:hypothetical protein
MKSLKSGHFVRPILDSCRMRLLVHVQDEPLHVLELIAD